MSHTIVIFGASGDLTSRKLIPALYQLYRKKRLPKDTRIVGNSRTAMTHEQFRESLAGPVKEFAEKEYSEESWKAFAPSIYYQAGDASKDDDFAKLAAFMKELEGEGGADRTYYLSTAPNLYESITQMLGKHDMNKDPNHARRIVIEKPFGVDLESAKHLNGVVHSVFDEKQVYRIDHYLGKETVQNMLVLRFANAIFEPIWNRNYIDHVQITAAEEVAVGRRAAFYETAGVLRDMFQNHLLQCLMMTAMEAPLKFEADAVRNEKVKVLQAIRPLTSEQIAKDTMRGQYDGYRQEPGAAPESRTATFGVVKFHVDNWRWQGVPFYLRSGKTMSCRTTQIVIQFKSAPQMLFGTCGGACEANRLVIQVQPAEGIQLEIQTKVPDAGMSLRMKSLDFQFAEGFNKPLPEAYERLLLDAIQGDASLFARGDEVETAWSLIDPIIKAWDSTDTPALLQYEQGNWGPDESTEWMRWQGRNWYDLCPVLSK